MPNETKSRESELAIFSRVHDLAAGLATLTALGDQRPQLDGWRVLVGNRWRQLAEMWAEFFPLPAGSRPLDGPGVIIDERNTKIEHLRGQLAFHKQQEAELVERVRELEDRIRELEAHNAR